MITVNELMTIDPLTVEPDTLLGVIVTIMQAEGYRQLPVVDNGRLVGIVSYRDVRSAMGSPLRETAVSASDELLNHITAESIMTPNPISVTPDTPIYRAAEMLNLYKVGALPVVDNQQLVGIITVSDFLEYFTASLKHFGSDFAAV